MKHLDDEFIGERQIHLSIVLTHIRQNAPLSRAALAEITGLNRATITRLVRELIEHGFVREAGFQSLHAGRPSILLQLDPDAGCIIGAAIEVSFGSVILTDLSARVLWRKELEFGDSDKQDAFLDNIAELVRQACSVARETNCHILGMGMSLPGLVDVSSGILLSASRIPWRDVPVKPWMEREFKIPIYVDNKANMAALAESYFGSARDSRIVLYVNIATEVGAGIVINRHIVSGVSGLAGEVGHMTIDPDGQRCSCGSHGCWETYVSDMAVFARVREFVLMGKTSLLGESVRDGVDQMTMPRLVEAARDGDEGALAAFEETGFYVGVGVANLINILNPQKVVLGGYVIAASEFLLPVIHKTVRERALHWPSQAADIVVATYEHDAGLMGAVATVYSQILSNPNRAFKVKDGFEQYKEVMPK